jgi:hypothetical protein
MKKASSAFLKKSAQKTFATLDRARFTPGARFAKVFWLLFSKK